MIRSISPFLDRKFHSARKWSNKVLSEIAPAFEGDIVNVSGWEDRDKEGGFYKDYFSGHADYFVTNYPGYRGHADRPGEIHLDLETDLPDDLRARFDVVFNHTTLEHIFEVRKAFANLCAMTRDIVIVVVPFSQVQHESASYGDYWRFSPSCLRRLFEENGLSVIFEAESDYRHSAVYLLFVGSRSPENYAGKLPDYRRLEEAGAWIGASVLVSGYQYVRKLLGKTN